MSNIIEIMNMLDWRMPSEIQSKGRELAKNVDNIQLFLQPVTEKHNKNIWDNCAIILAERSDPELKPHLDDLLEWLQDMNWPGAFCIFDRLKKFSDHDFLRSAIHVYIVKAKSCHDEMWEDNLNLLMQNID